MIPRRWLTSLAVAEIEVGKNDGDRVAATIGEGGLVFGVGDGSDSCGNVELRRPAALYSEIGTSGTDGLVGWVAVGISRRSAKTSGIVN
jgi:hypothetical protein